MMQFQQIVDEYSSTPSGHSASFYIGKIHFDKSYYSIELSHFERSISRKNNIFLNNSAYSATKFAINGLTQSLSKEVGEKNIRVNAVCPGVIDTPMNERNLEKTKNKSKLKKRWIEVTPLGRVASPYELAQTVLFLSSDMSSFITGVGLSLIHI